MSAFISVNYRIYSSHDTAVESIHRASERRLCLFAFLYDVNVEGRISHFVHGFKITVHLVCRVTLENRPQDILEHGQLVGIVGETEFTGISPAGANDVIHRHQSGLTGDVQNRRFDVCRVAAL